MALRHLTILLLLSTAAACGASRAASQERPAGKAASGSSAGTPAPATAEPPAHADMERLARRIEPELAGLPERLPQYINFFSRELANDSRICAFQVTAKRRGDEKMAIELNGYVEFPETRAALKGFLIALGFQVDDRLESLPAAGLGKQVFGFVKATHSYCFERPSGERKQENDCLFAEPLLLLREEDGHVLAHSSEGYLGYLPTADVVRVDEAAYLKYLDGPRVLVTADQRVDGQPLIPAGARLKQVSVSGDVVTAALPTGSTVQLPASACKVCTTPVAAIDDIVVAGEKLIGTPYFWGGRTSQGIDCSGLVQMSYAAAGLHLPRDSYQQFYVGQLTATRWHRAGMRRGDTLYFLGNDGKIRHTAFYLGNDQFIQAIMPKVCISSFNPKDSNYDAKRTASFAFAKRLVD
jgi:cell wall-associated NlpC family hydrolase